MSERVEFESRVSRCERALFGGDDSSDGLSSRMKVQELHTDEIRETLKKLNWLIIAGVVVGLLNLVMGRIPPHGSSAANTQSVNLGAADEAEATLVATHRTYLTTADVAKKEGVSVREVTDMITQGEIAPPPVKDGREWRIAEDYRILPHSADGCGIDPQSADF